MTIDQNTLAAILAFLGGGLITAIVQAIKKWIPALNGGWKAAALAAVLSIGGTAYVLISSGAFTVLALLIYSAVVFGTTTGLYHLSSKSPIR